MKKIPIIIDCDPGVDDAYAIALANSYEGFDIKAITPVAGNVIFEKTSRNALAIADILNIDCRVGLGANKPLVRDYKREASSTHGNSGVGSVVFPEITKKYDEKEAWDVIYEEAVAANGELILFAIGPLTNIAKAVEKYPDLPKIISKFVIMGGGTFGNVKSEGGNRKAEFNIWVDPHAAAIVFEKFEVYMVGLNSTHSAALTSADFDEMVAICEGGDSYLVKELSKFSQKNAFENGSDSNVIHDALAIATIMNPDVLRYEKHYAYVEDNMEADNMGETVCDLDDTSGKEPNCYVGMEANKDLFKDMLIEMCKFYSK